MTWPTFSLFLFDLNYSNNTLLSIWAKHNKNNRTYFVREHRVLQLCECTYYASTGHVRLCMKFPCALECHLALPWGTFPFTKFFLKSFKFMDQFLETTPTQHKLYGNWSMMVVLHWPKPDLHVTYITGYQKAKYKLCVQLASLTGWLCSSSRALISRNLPSAVVLTLILAVQPSLKVLQKKTNNSLTKPKMDSQAQWLKVSTPRKLWYRFCGSRHGEERIQLQWDSIWRFLCS